MRGIVGKLRLEAEQLYAIALQLRWQYAQRIRNDYRARETVSAMTARTSVELAEHIITNVESYLRAQHP